MLEIIALDADDTLWHNEPLYIDIQTRFKQLLSNYHSPEWIDQKLFDTEMRNLKHFGYGIKGFTLSMIETAIELSEGRIPGSEIQKIIDYAREMLETRLALIDQVEETLAELSQSYPLMIVTKGDLLDQEAKIANSGLGKYITSIEVLSHKTRESYAAILSRYKIEPDRFLMVGNSLKSDILPVLELGGHAVYIPYHLTWVHENNIEKELPRDGYYQIEHIGLLPELVKEISQKAGFPTNPSS
jgi:putative hydrolase of the HAD superfamily